MRGRAAAYLAAGVAAVAVLAAACGDSSPAPSPTEAVGSPTVVTPTGLPATPTPDPRDATSVSEAPDFGREPVTPFVEVAAEVLGDGSLLWGDRSGVAIFDFDRDGDLDLYLANEGGYPNYLYRNDGNLEFSDVAEEAGVVAFESFSTGVIACDIDNDGFQDLYVGAWGDPTDDLDYRSPSDIQGNADSLFLNNGDGTFRDITETAFGDAVNIRSAASIACADVDGDGWLDIYVGNLQASEFRTFASPSHPGHYNVLYMNNGDLTFTEVAEEAGVRGNQIAMRDAGGEPVLFSDPSTGDVYQGWDPRIRDRLGNVVGDPTSQTHAVLFFDHDDDGDPDLWLANDGDILNVFRNDTDTNGVRFTDITHEMGLDIVGAWMGFAVGDYDGDTDLDVFITNIGYHPLLRRAQEGPNGSCEYHHRFAWGTCLNYLVRNDGTREVAGLGTVGLFPDVAAATSVLASPILPPDSLDASRIYRTFDPPTGVAAYDFGFGATFFDYDNDGDQDLYWLGSTKGRGEGPGGDVYPGVGRMLRGDGRGGFEDITVRAHLLDIAGVDYSIIDPDDPAFDAMGQRMSGRFHENGKGLAHGDLDGDGFADLVGTNSSGSLWSEDQETVIVSAPGPVFVWINGGGGNSWITLALRGRMAIDGTGSNADGIGARVRLTSRPRRGEAPTVQIQEVRAGSSYVSMDSVELEFGVGSAGTVDEISIRWPSGRTQTLRNVAVNQVLEIVEPPE